MKIIWIVLIQFLVGCTVTQPHISQYTLAPKIQKVDYSGLSCKEKSLKVGKVFSSNTLMSKKMKYIQSTYKASAFTQSQWERTPSRAISDELVKSIRSSSLFDNISNYKSRSKTELILETYVEKFMQYFDEEGEKSYVKVVLTFNLLNAKNSSSVAHATFSSKIDVEDLDAHGGVVALNEGLSSVSLQTNNWLNGVCK